MKSVEHLFKIADRLARKISLAQLASAQAGEIESALKAAGQFPQPNDIAPLLNAANVPDNVSITIGLVVDNKLNVRFKVASSPPHPSSNGLQNRLQAKYGASMSQALKTAKLSVADVVSVGLATFSA